MSENDTDIKTQAPEQGVQTNAGQAPRKRRPLWVRILKWLGITAGVLAVLFIAVCSLIVWVLTPDRLTPMVEKYASEYLRADVRASRVELTFWSTFPKMTVDVDSLRLDSRSLDGPRITAGCLSSARSTAG